MTTLSIRTLTTGAVPNGAVPNGALLKGAISNGAISNGAISKDTSRAPVISQQLRHRVAEVTSARVFLGHVDGSYRTESLLALCGDQALARRAVTEPMDLTKEPLAGVVSDFGIYEVASAAPSMAVHLANPTLGRRLSDAGRARVTANTPSAPRIQFVIGDGLSATAVHVQVPRLLPLLLERCALAGWSTGQPFAVRHCRVGVLGDVGEATGADLVALLIGERPGLGSAESLSIYTEWRPTRANSDANRNVISNIHDRGLAPAMAADRAMDLFAQILLTGVSGVALPGALLASDPVLDATTGSALATTAESPTATDADIDGRALEAAGHEPIDFREPHEIETGEALC